MGKKPNKKEVSHTFKQKNPKNKKNKYVLLFDESKREDFLTGFRKRKNERRKKAQEDLVQQVKEEKKRRREQQREMLQKDVPNKRCQQLPDVEDLVESHTYELPSHTVTVTDVTEVDFVGTGGLMLGTNKEEDVKDEDAKQPDNKAAESKEKSLQTKKKFKKSRHINRTHLMDKKKKFTLEDRRRLKKKLKKQQKRNS